ncbi:GNAT family N-acetyltransferase [Hyphomonas atlantica corrig.]|uniref:GNAT family N-acetyltransferase n=1 Tax=Hyphomonas atlantica TaxID=1280948 RepID=UPI002357B6EF|nr:GNAT family N-acetyltransferase [Hyphomonas atlantica]
MSDPNYPVRSATLEDLPALKACEQGIIAAERPYDHTLKPDPISYYDLGELVQSDDAEVAVIEIDGNIIATGYAHKRPSKAYVASDHHAYLGFMFVHPDHRGRGLNRVLIDHLTEWARTRGLPELRLEVYSNNAPALRAYEKTGFKPYITEMRLNLDEQP